MLPTEESLQALQREVQRLLGRCLLRLQQYERLIKAIVAHHDIAGPAHALESIRAERIADTATKTLGTLVGYFVGSYVVTDEADNSDKVEDTCAPMARPPPCAARMATSVVGPMPASRRKTTAFPTR